MLPCHDAKTQRASGACMSEAAAAALVHHAAAAKSGQPSFQEAKAAVIIFVVVVVVTMMMVMVVVMVVVTVMVIPTLRRRIAVGLLAVVKVALVPRRWLLRRRVVRPLRWSLGRWVRLRVPWWRIGLRDLLVTHGSVVALAVPRSDRFSL